MEDVEGSFEMLFALTEGRLGMCLIVLIVELYAFIVY